MAATERGNLLWHDHTSSAFPENSSYSFLETTRITRGWSITYQKHCSAFEVKFHALAQYRKAILEKYTVSLTTTQMYTWLGQFSSIVNENFCMS